MFGTEPPRYKMIDSRLCYLYQYNGVAVRAWNDVPCVVNADGDKAEVYILCRSIDSYDLMKCTLEKCPDGKWRTSNTEYLL